MQQNSGFSMAEAAKLLAPAEGQQLLALLRRDGGDALSQAAAAMRAGDAEGAKAILQPILGTPEAAALLEQLNRRR